ncbi:MAG: M15 family metallopeptidase, partial [Treponema sp.]|nr:M15 family metallopeptidase [Treponema sp.]
YSRLYPSPGAARSPFYENLWQARSREEAYSRQQWISFLGRQVHIHGGIAGPLKRAEARIAEGAKTDPDIQGWLKNLHSITGWNWRNVAGSENRSFHAYGVAVDLLLKAQPGMETYWQWTAAKGIDWRSVPPENRQNPPAAVIRAFEEQGFIWGGRWSRYDTMHFEYHPELLILGTGRNPAA